MHSSKAAVLNWMCLMSCSTGFIRLPPTSLQTNLLRHSYISPTGGGAVAVSVQQLQERQERSFLRRTVTSSSLHATPDPALPTWDELSQQKSEALRSLSETHDGRWICKDGATSFAITSDVAAGITQKKISCPYETAVTVRLGLMGTSSRSSSESGGEALKLVESLSWKEEHHGDEHEGGFFYARSSPLGSYTDVDAVDGSYSTQATVQQGTNAGDGGLPQTISGIDPNKVSTVIESVVVTGESSRVRSFLLYGKDKAERNGDDDDSVNSSLQGSRLMRVVVSYEEKDGVGGAKTGDDSSSLMDPKSLNPPTQMDQLAKVLDPSNSEGERRVEFFPSITMMSLSLGPWLGDIVIRDKTYNIALPTSKKRQTPSKGFGVSKPKGVVSNQVDPSKGFADWIMGVQKVAMTFKWDFGENVRQTFDFGKSIGSYCADEWPLSSAAILNDEGMSRRIPPNDRSMYLDYDMGAYAGFLLGSIYIKAPRFFNFPNQLRNNGGGRPMLTIFSVFQRTGGGISSSLEKTDDQETTCYQIARLYESDGTLKQGSTAFFEFKPMIEEGMIDTDITP